MGGHQEMGNTTSFCLAYSSKWRRCRWKEKLASERGQLGDSVQRPRKGQALKSEGQWQGVGWHYQVSQEMYRA